MIGWVGGGRLQRKELTKKMAAEYCQLKHLACLLFAILTVQNTYFILVVVTNEPPK
jgi:hypothetical protein